MVFSRALIAKARLKTNESLERQKKVIQYFQTPKKLDFGLQDEKKEEVDLPTKVKEKKQNEKMWVAYNKGNFSPCALTSCDEVKTAWVKNLSPGCLDLCKSKCHVREGS